MKQTFIKGERISSQREIDILFGEGFSFMVYPLRVIYVKKPPLSGMRASVLVSVSKKRFKSAVKRNRIKRLIREAYRLNKNALLSFLEEKDQGVLIAFIFVSKEMCGYHDIEAAMQKALGILKERCS